MPNARVRLSAGRESMSSEAQSLCLQAGAESIFYGDVLLTRGNSDVEDDRKLLADGEAAGAGGVDRQSGTGRLTKERRC